jgi:hypothetical protein
MHDSPGAGIWPEGQIVSPTIIMYAQIGWRGGGLQEMQVTSGMSASQAATGCDAIR